MSTVTGNEPKLDHRIIDALIELYIRWRGESSAVQQTYERWDGSNGEERSHAYSGYLAALDREERAAGAYSRAIERVARILA